MIELFFNFLIPILLVAVVLVLLAGWWNMIRGGSAGRSQTLMRWRVGLQFIAIVIVMTAFYLTSN